MDVALVGELLLANVDTSLDPKVGRALWTSVFSITGTEKFSGFGWESETEQRLIRPPFALFRLESDIFLP